MRKKKKKKTKERKIVKKKKRKPKKIRPKKKRRARKKRGLPRGRPKKVFLPEKFQRLLEKGKKRGFVTPSEILFYFPEIERDIRGLEKLYEDLEKEGVEVQEAREFLVIEEKGKKPAKEAEIRIDPVQMYLKEIGKVPFVTAAEGKEWGKRTEKGDEEA